MNQISERGRALILAAAVLDRPNADPDDDIAVLARQLTRAQEEIDLHHQKLAESIFGRDIVQELASYEVQDMASGNAKSLDSLLKRAAAEITRLRSLAGVVSQGDGSFRDVVDTHLGEARKVKHSGC